MDINIYNFTDEWVDSIVDKIKVCATNAIKECGIFNIVLPGGNTPILIFQKLSLMNLEWDKWHFWLSDERILVNDTSNLNKYIIYKNLLDNINYEKKQIHFLIDNLSLNDSIIFYENELKKVFFFDLLLLGIGEDGHTASLFPGNNLGLEQNSPNVLGINNSPKAPSNRITLSTNRLNKSYNILFLVKGPEKKDIIDKIIKGESYPCTNISGLNETKIYYCTK